MFEKYQAVDSTVGYGRTVYRDNVRHSDRETTINKLMMKHRMTEKYLNQKNASPEMVVQNIEMQQLMEQGAEVGGTKSLELTKKKTLREGTIKQKMERLVKIVELEEQKQA